MRHYDKAILAHEVALFCKFDLFSFREHRVKNFVAPAEV